MILATPAERFALTTSALCRAVAACLGRGLMSVAMIVLVHTRVRRAEVAFLALVERVRSGRFRGGWQRDGATGGTQARRGGDPSVPGTDGGVAREPGVDDVGQAAAVLGRGRLPTRFGWLMGLMPYEAAGYGSQLRTVLAEPDMVALMRDVAQARRILGPVCRMLGVEIPGVRLAVSVKPTVSEPPRAARVRVRPSRPAVDWGRVPLPRGVLAAARRQGYGKVPAVKND